MFVNPSTVAGLLTVALGASQPPSPGGAGERPATAEPALVELVDDEPANTGPHRANTVATRTVTLRNISGSTLALRVVGTSCPCTTARLDAAQVGAGSSVRAVLTTNVAEVGATQWYTATIEASEVGANGSAARRQTVPIPIGYVPAAESVVYPRVFELCAVEGEHATFEMFVRRLDLEPITVERVVTPGDWIKVEHITPSKDRAFESAVELSCAQDKPGVYRGLVDGYITGDTERTHAQVNLRVEEPLIASPTVLIWREQAGKWDNPMRQVRLTANPLAKRAYAASSAVVSNQAPHLKLSPVTNDASDPQTLTVTLEPSSLPGESTSGVTYVQLLDEQGKTLCSLPTVWFRESSLTPHLTLPKAAE